MNYEKLPKTISAEELLSTPLPPVKWIIPDLLPAGLALFAGPSKAGKSWLTLWLCLQVAQGKPMWGREIEPHTVLYLSLEDTFNRLQKRLLQLVGSEEAPERLVMQTECSSIGQGLEEQLTSFLYQHPDTGLIVIDTLQKVRSSDQNNSMYASDYKEISALKALADKYNICILLIHHLRKQAADDPFQQIAGSNGLMGASDTSWVMQRKRMSQTASILVTGRDMDNKTLRLHEENCVWMLDEEESTEQIVAKAVPGYIWKVADYIDSLGTWQGTATELLSAADIEGVLPHQLTRKIVEHFDTVFTPRGIRYETHRTSQARQMKFSHDGNDADDANDADIDITQLFKWDISQTASSASLASQRSRKESKHFVCNLNTLVGVHQHPVDQQLGQLGGQRVRIENRLGRFLAAVLPCLFVLLLFRLCQYCGIGIFRFQKQLVTRSLFRLVGVQVNLAHKIVFVKCALAVLQRLDLLLIFGAFRYGGIHPERTVRGKRCGGFHLLFQRQEYRLFQLCGVQTHLVAAAFFVCLGMAAVIIRGFLHGAGQRMTAAATEGFAFQRVVPLLFVGLGKAELAGLHGIKHGFLYDGRVMGGDDVP